MYILSFVCTGFIFSFRRSVPSILSFLLIQIFFEIRIRPLVHWLPFLMFQHKEPPNHGKPTICVKLRPIAQKYEHLRVNQIQLRFFHFNQHSIILLGIQHWAYKREKYTFIHVNIKVVNIILKVNRDN